MDIVNPRVDEHLNNVAPKSPPPFDEMEKYARENHFPIIGPLVGRFLQQLVPLTNARRIFELGSGYGYSALWMALALPEDGKVICTDGNEKHRDMAFDFFKRVGQEQKLDFRVGDAIEILKKEKGPFDIFLNDIDKHGYPDTIQPVKERLRPGGVFVTDNLLYNGRIFEDDLSESGRGVLEFTRRLYEDTNFLTSIMPIRDGISIAVKKA